MPRGEKTDLCRWKCGRKTTNRSGVCSPCWKDSENLTLEQWAERKGMKPKRTRIVKKKRRKKRVARR